MCIAESINIIPLSINMVKSCKVVTVMSAAQRIGVGGWPYAEYVLFAIQKINFGGKQYIWDKKEIAIHKVNVMFAVIWAASYFISSWSASFAFIWQPWPPKYYN